MCVRTTLAYLIAPATTPIIYGMWAALEHPSRNAFKTLVSYASLACLISYPICLFFGTAAFLLLRKLRRENFLTYAIAAGATGFLYGLVAGLSASKILDAIYLGTLFGVLSVPTGIVFHLIRSGCRLRAPQSARA